MDFDKYEFGDKELIWCHWDLVRFLSPANVDPKKHIVGLCDYRTLKDSEKQVIVDLRVFFYMEDGKYILRVYKDDVNYDLLSFDDMEEALAELDMLPYNHPEYTERPIKVLNE